MLTSGGDHLSRHRLVVRPLLHTGKIVLRTCKPLSQGLGDKCSDVAKGLWEFAPCTRGITPTAFIPASRTDYLKSPDLPAEPETPHH